MYYTQAQWLLVFFIYCFLGWIWESFYVSIEKKEWVNRGFLHGPLLPIYGFSAIIMLLITLPFGENIVLIFLLGSIGVSVIEYVTGFTMEKAFHIRYWDYSHRRFNLNGYISLFTSLAWGVFSLLLVKVIHPFVEELILQIPNYIAEAVSLVLLVSFVADATISIQSALDMKKLLKLITEHKKLISSLELKISEVASDLNQTSEEFKRYTHIIRAELNHFIQAYQNRAEAEKQSKIGLTLELVQKLRHREFNLLKQLNEKVDITIKAIQLKVDSTSSKLENVQLTRGLKDLDEFRGVLKKIELNITSLRYKEFRAAINIIRKYPFSSSKHFKEALDEIKSLYKSNKKKNKGV